MRWSSSTSVNDCDFSGFLLSDIFIGVVDTFRQVSLK